MLSALLTRPGNFEIVDQPVPTPGDGQVLVKVEECGVCGSDVKVYEGLQGIEYPMEPGRPGHEVYGRVIAAGPDAKGLKEGMLVTGLVEQGYRQYITVPSDQLIQLPDNMSAQTFLGEPLGCAANVMRRAGIKEGDKVIIIGIGFLGALLIQMAKTANPERIIAISKRPSSQYLAYELGAKYTFGIDDPELYGRIYWATDNYLADVVIECTGKQQALDLATDFTNTRGRLVIAGYHSDGQRCVNMQQWNWKGLDVINAHERDPQVYLEGMKLAADYIERSEVNVDKLLTHSFELSEINQAFQTAVDRPDGFVKATIRMPER